MEQCILKKILIQKQKTDGNKFENNRVMKSKVNANNSVSLVVNDDNGLNQKEDILEKSIIQVYIFDLIL